MKRLVSIYCDNPTEKEIELAKAPALDKLGRIIEREGDLNGKRVSARYLAQLIAEQIEVQRAELFSFEQKRRAAEIANAPTSQQYNTLIFVGCQGFF